MEEGDFSTKQPEMGDELSFPMSTPSKGSGALGSSDMRDVEINSQDFMSEDLVDQHSSFEEYNISSPQQDDPNLEASQYGKYLPSFNS
jgi:hypothetical protein